MADRQDQTAGQEALIARATRAGCEAANVHLRCTYPDCACKQIPAAVATAAALIFQEPASDAP